MHAGGSEGAGRGQRWGGFVLASLAAGLLILSAFMPKLHCDTIQIRENRLIDSWEGVALIGIAVLVVLGAGLGLWQKRWAWLSSAGGVAGLGIVIYAGTGSRLIVGFDEAPVRGIVGIGLLTAGLGAVVAIAAGLIIALAPTAGPGASIRSVQTARR